MPFKTLQFILPALVSLFLAAPSLCAEDEPPSTTVEFYYTNDDPHLAATEKLLSEATKKLGLQFERLPLEDKKNAKRLSKHEKNLEMKSVGEMTVVWGPHYLNSKGTVRDIETFFVPMMERLVKQGIKGDMTHKDRLKPDVAAYAKEIYGDGATPVDPPAAAKFEANIFYEIKKDGKRAGWLVDGYDPIGCPVCSATQFLLAADAKGTIIGVRPVHAIERIGLKLTDAETETFVKQFKGKKPADEPLKVDGISRATKTVKAYTSSINEILEELKNRTKE